MNEIPVRMGKGMVFEMTYAHNRVVVEPFEIRRNDLVQRPELVRFDMGMAMADVDVTLNIDQICFIKKRVVPFIHMAEYLDDEDGNEVLAWGVADYQVASKLQFHQTNHTSGVGYDCECGVVIAETDSEGVGIRWDVTL